MKQFAMMIYPCEVSDIRPKWTLALVKKIESILALVTADSPHPNIPAPPSFEKESYWF